SPPMNVALARVDLQTHVTRVIRPASDRSVSWLIDDAGEGVADETYNPYAHHWSISLQRDGHAREVASGQENIEYPAILGWGPEADTLLLSQIEDGDPVWRLLSLKDGSIGPPLAERQQFDAALEDRATNRMVGGIHVVDSQEL